MNCCGIDPGLNGAVAYVSGNGSLVVYDMPTIELGGKRALDLPKLRSILRVPCAFTLLERAIPMTYTNKSGQKRGQSAAGSFTFGMGYGVLVGMLAAFEKSYHEVMPSVWKSKLSLGRDKRASLDQAAELFPDQAGLFLRLKDDGRAEATLLAHLCARVFEERQAPQAALAQIL